MDYFMEERNFHYREERNTTRVRTRYHPRKNLDTRKMCKNTTMG